MNFKNTALSEVLIFLEKEYDIKFSYKNQIIENLSVYMIQKVHSKEEVFKKIEGDLPIIFTKINERYFIIKRKVDAKNLKSISGFVMAKSSGEKLVGAEVMSLEKRVGILTNQEAYFRLDNIPINDTILIRYLGYAPQLIAARSFSLQDTIQMIEEIVGLNEVIVRDYLTSGLDRNDNGSFKINPNRLGLLPGLTEPDLFESLQMLPGIQSPDESASGLHIRGGTPDQNLVLWDGINIFQSGHLFGAISALNPYVTKDVQVFKSGVSARYGNRISGVIDFNSGEKVPTKTEGGLGFNMTHADAYLKTPLANKNIGLILSFRRSYTDAFNTFTNKRLSKKTFQATRKLNIENNLGYDPLISNNSYYYIDYNIKTIAKLSSKDQLTMNYLLIQNELDYVTNDIVIKDATKDDLKIKNNGFHISWKRNWTNRFSHSLKFSNSLYDLNYRGTYSYENELLTIKLKENQINDLSAEFQSNYKISQTKSLVLGYQFGYNNTSFGIDVEELFNQEDSYRISDDYKDVNHAVYLEYQMKSKAYYLNAGVRMNRFAKSKETFLEPRLNIEYSLHKNLRMRLSGGIKNQPISQIVEYETSDFGLENQLWILADGESYPFLRSKQVSWGLIWKKNNWQIDIESYYKRIKGLTSLTRGFTNDVADFSYGKNTSIGLEILVKKRIKNFRTWVSYTLAKSDFRFSNLEEANRFSGNYDVRHNLVLANSYKYKNIELSLGWRFHSGKPYTHLELDQSDNETNIVYEKVNGSRLPVYHRLDLSATYKLQLSKTSKSNMKLGFSILNLYDRKNIVNRYYYLLSGGENGEVLIRNDRRALGITPNVIFRYHF
ncbi:TonB-dependent receptor plug domain-containing protein [Marinifilum caeruleilacunae]|uniref:TonB-dependent receptor plug domain-containing protein n=1 Tax=Marinifilum caeruleilacunae TaxID=2499076 RepID=UPI001490C3A6|nr:TonB-dependent receptor plug domain-containing protein [Marinifilum caeruleilacunae]